MRYLDPDGRYEVDGHYWTVYLAAMVSGRGNARGLAYGAEYPDHAMTAGGDVAYGRFTWMLPHYQVKHHALTGGDAAYERRYSRALYQATGDPAYLHRLGDSYSHSKSNGTMYSTGRGHAPSKDPDKIANRPELYLQYVNNLIGTLGGSNADLFTFEYVANGGGSTEQNSAIFETEIRLREGINTFSVAGKHGSAIGSYINARNAHYGSSYKTVTTEVDRYTRDENGDWVKRTETRTYVTSQ